MLMRSQLCSSSGRLASPAPLQRPCRAALLPGSCPSSRVAAAGPRSWALHQPACSAAAAASGPWPEDTTSSSRGQQEQQQAGPSPASLQQTLQLHPAVAMVAAMVHLALAAVDKLRNAVSAALPAMDAATTKDLLIQVRSFTRSARMMAMVVLPLARAASSESLTAVYARTFERAAFGFAKMYVFCLFLRVLLSWFPDIDWNVQPWTFLRLVTEPYLNIYRGILPPLFGQLDFTPLLGFLILQDVVEVMSPTYTMGLHHAEVSENWTTSDALAFFNGF